MEGGGSERKKRQSQEEKIMEDMEISESIFERVAQTEVEKDVRAHTVSDGKNEGTRSYVEDIGIGYENVPEACNIYVSMEGKASAAAADSKKETRQQKSAAGNILTPQANPLMTILLASSV
ncbi:hypothetical protein QAD02_022360 [Eretmocerus hayati]|uniref:Uncharacterized protein n=1 Tax=Eretmocerus hayati TaxID=131215 RepID=A0ACC2PUE7_9HYME|nr:hypothetical protein QAD02_022360 [Eretmocerus hayati]